MVDFDASLTDPPGIDSDDPTGTATNWVGYVIIASLAFAALAMGRQGASFIQEKLSNITGNQVGDGSPGGMAFGGGN